MIFYLENVTIGSGVDQNKKSPSFGPIGQKMLILHEKLKFLMARDIFSIEKGFFFTYAMDQKDGNFLF